MLWRKNITVTGPMFMSNASQPRFGKEWMIIASHTIAEQINK